MLLTLDPSPLLLKNQIFSGVVESTNADHPLLAELELIAETMLYSEGFKHAKKLSTKIVSLFKLCK